MIVITGAAGFIGSHLCKKLNFHGIKNIILVDNFTQEKKQKNWERLEYADKIQREHFFQWAEQNVQHIDFIFHLGARTDYFSIDYDIFEMFNVDFSQRIWSFATCKRIPLVYASSYLTNDTRALSPFAKSKYIFDKWIEKQQQVPPLWAGLKFFQVYGKNEEHKADNSSLVYKMYKNFTENVAKIYVEKNVIQDYIYVNDVCKVLYYFLNHVPQNGIYEVGTGFARPLQAIIDALNKATKSKQKLTLEYRKEDPFVFQADLTLLRKYAYQQAFFSLEQGIKSMFRDGSLRSYLTF
jgi:ADP-L-glycero-D-manno-heptose 6-epimerase